MRLQNEKNSAPPQFQFSLAREMCLACGILQFVFQQAAYFTGLLSSFKFQVSGLSFPFHDHSLFDEHCRVAAIDAIRLEVMRCYGSSGQNSVGTNGHTQTDHSAIRHPSSGFKVDKRRT
jgi:hypothetical protein